jgi:hypothetical protein
MLDISACVSSTAGRRDGDGEKDCHAEGLYLATGPIEVCTDIFIQHTGCYVTSLITGMTIPLVLIASFALDSDLHIQV